MIVAVFLLGLIASGPARVPARAIAKTDCAPAFLPTIASWDERDTTNPGRRQVRTTTLCTPDPSVRPATTRR